MQVYQLLDNVFDNCPFPIPISAILLHLPILERPEKGNGEKQLRTMLSRNKMCMSAWKFQPVRIISSSQGAATSGIRQTYACKAGATQVSLLHWAKFLTNFWTSHDLDVGARLMHARSAEDLSEAGAALMERLRKNHEVLMLEKNASIVKYTDRLKQLYQLGMLNLSLELVGSRNTPASQLKSKMLSFSSRLRESKKRESKLERRLKFEQV